MTETDTHLSLPAPAPGTSQPAGDFPADDGAEVIKPLTRSICGACLAEVPARVLVRDGRVHLEKRCPAHGVSSAVIEPDPAFYRAVCHTGANRRPFDPAQKRLIIPVEYRCNLDCMFCYLPDRTKPNLSCERIERAIQDFDGDSIELSGGEPTLREDLLDLVRLVRKYGKRLHLVTNGLRLADLDYVRQLKEAGLHKPFLSLYSLDRETERQICGRDVLDLKLRAFENLLNEGMAPALSFTLVPGVNNGSIRDLVFLTARSGLPFVTLRRVARVGTHPDSPRYFFSEFVADIARALGWTPAQILQRKQQHFSPYFLYLTAWVSPAWGKCIPCRGREETPEAALERLPREAGDPLPPVGAAEGPPVQRVRFRIAAWPDIEDIDLDEASYQMYQHLYDGEKPMDFFQAMIRNEGL
ncbi:MAG: radical SAM protein [Acidobacteria bacterium]|nr:radical SAM protein [Acidobacteriota bacterium]